MEINESTITIKGEGVMYGNDEQNRFLIRYDTFIAKVDNDPNYVDKLKRMKIDVKSLTGDGVYNILLPFGWLHLDLGNKQNEVITDNLGRRRIEINYKTKQVVINRRFTYEIIYVRDDKLLKSAIKVICYDAGKIMNDIFVDDKLYNETIADGYSNDEILRLVQDKTERNLDEAYPDWRNPSSYWDGIK